MNLRRQLVLRSTRERKLFHKIEVVFMDWSDGSQIRNGRFPSKKSNQIEIFGDSLLLCDIHLDGTLAAYIVFIDMLDEPNSCSSCPLALILSSIVFSCFIAWSMASFPTRKAHAAELRIGTGIERNPFALEKVQNG